MSAETEYVFQGGCSCRKLRYTLSSKPLFVHCCHCRWCQRETGSAFVLNAMCEADRVNMTLGEPMMVNTPSESGRGQHISRCPDCFVAVWSTYSNPNIRFVRVGTLDEPDKMPPDIHIFTSSKQPWVKLDGALPEKEEFYKKEEYWPRASLDRLKTFFKL